MAFRRRRVRFTGRRRVTRRVFGRRRVSRPRKIGYRM